MKTPHWMKSSSQPWRRGTSGSAQPQLSADGNKMRSPITALVWEMWGRNRTFIRVLAAITIFSCVFNSVLPGSIRAAGASVLLELMNFHLGLASLLLVLAICSYTEFNPQKASTGFPHRLFVLPITSLELVAVPMMVGVAAMEIVCLA